MQHEITKAIPLLDGEGNLTEPGYAKSLLPIYRRGDIKASRLRIKEWDYYLINNGRFALALTVDDNGYMGLDSISLLDFDEGWQVTRSPMRLMPLGGTGLPQSSLRGSCARAGRGYGLLFQHEGEGLLEEDERQGHDQDGDDIGGDEEVHPQQQGAHGGDDAHLVLADDGDNGFHRVKPHFSLGGGRPGATAARPASARSPA